MSYIVRKPICAFEEWEAKKEEGADLFSARVTIADYCAEKNQHYCNIKDFFYRDADWDMHGIIGRMRNRRYPYRQMLNWCYEDDTGVFYVLNDDETLQIVVNFCPFCGKKAPTQLYELENEDREKRLEEYIKETERHFKHPERL
jgi:hypothetical protein